MLFVGSMVIPVFIHLGPLRLSVYRIALILLLLPMLVRWAGLLSRKTRSTDVFVLLFALWGVFSLLVADGLVSLEAGGIFVVETLGSYLAARCYIRTRDDFEAVMRVLFWMVSVLLPFAVFENLTGRPVILEAFGRFASVPANIGHDPRWGFDRAQTVFEHPILFGVFCSSVFAPSVYIFARKRRGFLRFWRTGILLLTTATSLSAGALMALVGQGGLIAWDAATRGVRNRWAILAALAAVAYVAVDLLSNRTPIQVFISYFTFNPFTGYIRLHIWDHGTAAVLNNPIFGIGLTGDWERPHWLTSSVDNFFLLISMRHGLPATIFLLGAIASVLYSIGRINLENVNIRACRFSVLVVLGGWIMAGMTVHFWNATFCLFMFYLGAGLWIADGEPDESELPCSGKVRSKRSLL